MNYFIADLHFGHENILAYDNMPYKDIMEHDVELKYKWNSVVGDDDDVYIIGNLSWLSVKNTVRLLKSLKGKKHLIKGPHDHVLLREKEVRDCFVEVRDYKELSLEGGKGIVLFYSPILFYNNAHKGWLHFHGGLRGACQENIIEYVKGQIADLQNYPARIVNISTTKPYMDFTPRTLEELTGCYGNGSVKKKGGKIHDIQSGKTA